MKPVIESDDPIRNSPIGLYARADTLAFMLAVPIKRKLKNDLEVEPYELACMCSAATLALDMKVSKELSDGL